MASPARSRTSSATTASGTRRARSPRPRSGRAARACVARRSSFLLLRVGDAQVERLVVVRRDLGAAFLENRAVADGAVADAKDSVDLLRRADHGLAVSQREHLAP